MFGFRLAIAALLFAMLACQTPKRTQLYRTTERIAEADRRLSDPIVLTESVVVLDARTSFDYSVARIPRSASINWAEFNEADPKLRGWPQKDLFAAARRLARLGVSPDREVVVFGYGKAGQGEEGRVAWFLAYLGLSKVQFAKFGSIRTRITNSAPAEVKAASSGDGYQLLDPEDESAGQSAVEQPLQAAPMWKPEVVESLLVTRDELRRAVPSMAKGQPLKFGDWPARRYKLIDVREAREYLGQSGLRSREMPNLEGINIPWKEFFDSNLRPDPAIDARLQSVDLQKSDRLIVIDSAGVASAAVTLALRSMGYRWAGLYAGGLNDLSSN